MSTWMTRTDAAEYVGLSPAYLAELASKDAGPIYSKLGHRTVRYCLDDLDAWLESQKVVRP